MMNQEEHVIMLLKSNLKQQCERLVYVIIVMHIYFLKEIYSLTGADANNTNKKVIFKNCDAFNDCVNEVNNTEVDNTKCIDIVMPMYKLIKYSNNYSKTSGSLWQYCKDIPAVDGDGGIVDFNGAIVEFNGANATDSFNFKAKITDETNDDENMNKHDMACGDFKDLARRTASGKAFNIAKNGYQKGLASLIYKLFDKKAPSLVDKSEAVSDVNKPQNEQLAEELHKRIIKNSKKITVYILDSKTIFVVLI